MKKTLSVIIPSYNVQQYLDEAVTSYVKPYYDERLEVIIVNDGSTDDTEKIANRYQEQYPNIVKVISKANGGHGSTINEGIPYASGKYLKVIDGDDYINNAVLKHFLDFLDSTDADVVTNDKIEFLDGKDIKKTFAFGTEKYGKIYSIEEINENWNFFIHRISIKTELMKQYMPKIDENCFYVDQEFIVYILSFVKTLISSDAVLYYYRLGNINQSVSAQNMFKRRDNLERVINSLLSFYSQFVDNKMNRNVKNYINRRIAQQVNNYCSIVLSNPKSTEDDYRIVDDFLQRINRNYSEIVQVMPQNKYIVLYQKCPRFLFRIIVNARRKKNPTFSQ